MERRGFLTLLAGAGAALLVPLPKFLVYEPERLRVPIEGLDAVRLRDLTKGVLDVFERAMPHAALIDGSRLGDRGLSNQFHVTAALRPGSEVDIKRRLLDPSGEVLANYARHHRLSRFGQLPAPISGDNSVTVVGQRAAVRGTFAYDIAFDEHCLRFDLIGGERN